jgi:hypothetical protein
MSRRVGGLLVITGLVLALVIGAMFVVVGTFLAVWGGLMAAIGMETTVPREGAQRKSDVTGA